MLTTSKSSQPHQGLPQIGLLTGAVVWGLIWYPFRQLQSLGIGGELASFLAYGLGLLVLLAWRSAPWQGGRLMWAIALSSGVTNVAYVLAANSGPIMLVMLLFYLAPAWTVLLARFLLREHISRVGLLAVLGSLVGTLMMLWQPIQWTSGTPWKSIVYGLTAGFCFALSNVLARKGAHYSLMEKSIGIFSGVTLVAFLALFFSEKPIPLAGIGELLSLQTAGLLLLVALAIFIANWGVQYGISHLDANRAILILLFELVVAAVASHGLAGEIMRWQEWLGGGLIIGAGLLANWRGAAVAK